MTELLKVSPTSLSSFDVDTAFGCKRKWWFKYVMGLREPQSPGAVKGDKVHKVLEALLTRPVEDTQEFDREALYIATSAGEYIEQMRKDGDWHIEVSLEEKKLLPGCVLVGRIDALHSRSKTIRDWKTMKSLQYAKPSMMLDQDLQMQLYAASVADEGEHINIEHINLTTERPYQSLRTFSVSTPEKRAVVLDKALALADGMRIYKTISDVNDTEPDRSKCRFCAFKDRCPTGEKTVNLLNTLLGTPAVTPAATPATAAPAPTVVVPTGILPPEVKKAKPFQAVPPPRSTPPMPKSTKKLVIQETAPEPTTEVLSKPSAEPSTTDTSTATAPPAATDEAPKRGRGRPPGVKNKPKDEPTTNIIDTAEAALTVTSISVTRGATVQVVQFEPMRIEITATANVSGLPLAEAVQELDSQVLAEVVRRMQEMQAAKVGK
jgi:CRISPR/Cas system-associated exonuclease Cas4 (RecB family)